MSQLTYVKIEGFRCLDSVELNLRDPRTKSPIPFAAIVGPNGSGKSSILDAICIILIRIVTGTGALIRDMELGVALGPHSGASVRMIKGQMQHDVGCALAALQALLLKTLFLPPSRDPVLPYQSLKPGGERRRFDINSSLSSHPATTTTRASVLHQWMLIQLMGPGLDTLWSAIQPFMGDYRYDHVHEETFGLVFKRSNGALVPFNALSSGQRKLIFMFAEILIHCGEDGLLLIDEPEAHLHPAWQVKMPGALQRLMPRGQIIVATHSPFIIDGLKPHQLFVLGDIVDGEGEG